MYRGSAGHKLVLLLSTRFLTSSSYFYQRSPSVEKGVKLKEEVVHIYSFDTHLKAKDYVYQPVSE
jgi:hypothetical protein